MTCGHLEVMELCVFVAQSCSGHSPEGLAAAVSVCCYCGGSIALPNVTGIPRLSCLPALRRHSLDRIKLEIFLKMPRLIPG